MYAEQPLPAPAHAFSCQAVPAWLSVVPPTAMALAQTAGN